VSGRAAAVVWCRVLRDNSWVPENAPKYDAKSIVVLTGMQAIRKRPHMYFGVGRDHPDLAGRLLWTAVRDASAEDAPVDAGLRVEVTVESDLVFIVEDNGPGISVERRVHDDGPWVAVALTKLLVGTGSRRGGLLSWVTAISSAVVADLWRDGKHWRQWADWEHQPPSLQDLGPTDRQGTRLRFHLDAGYLGPRAALPADVPGFLAGMEATEHEVPKVDMLVVDRRVNAG
jgi:DNA gyrase subunit B